MYRHMHVCSFENFLVAISWNKKERRWYSGVFIKNPFISKIMTLYLELLNYFLVIVCWGRADLCKLSSAWWGNGRIWKSFLKMSVYELFLSYRNTVSGEKCLTHSLFRSVKHCVQDGAL